MCRVLWACQYLIDGEKSGPWNIFELKGENHLGKITLSTTNGDSNPDLPIIDSLVQHESDALDHAATKAVVTIFYSVRCSPLTVFSVINVALMNKRAGYASRKRLVYSQEDLFLQNKEFWRGTQGTLQSLKTRMSYVYFDMEGWSIPYHKDFVKKKEREREVTKFGMGREFLLRNTNLARHLLFECLTSIMKGEYIEEDNEMSEQLLSGTAVLTSNPLCLHIIKEEIKNELDCYGTQLKLESTNDSLVHSVIKKEIKSNPSASSLCEDLGVKEELCFDESSIDVSENKIIRLSQNVTNETNRIEGFQEKGDQLKETTFLNMDPNIYQKVVKKHKFDDYNKFLTKKSNPKINLYTHIEQRPHKCDICSMGFKTKRTLKIHHLVHSVQRPHKCEVCSKSFKMKYNLKNHFLTHMDKNVTGVMFVVDVYLQRKSFRGILLKVIIILVTNLRTQHNLPTLQQVKDGSSVGLTRSASRRSPTIMYQLALCILTSLSDNYCESRDQMSYHLETGTACNVLISGARQVSVSNRDADTIRTRSLDSAIISLT
ncbi:unnamed protein product [Timema podura]|uniref:C2H2-type domain-containing protein n=1 Tax=Timema podura TaxID=61482 RepID=A0ABN7NUF8_TIMPD|nr:unnamed protein product [Timema podura]